ncbi:helix-turn-helix domain-containing protein [Phenylobacterium terrae]|uniref:Helix-turn-helix domain-containing protein n=1 Tax=Phenylobacterium terrae TaxID=2665495 RepID=A0ABW4N8M8_9CAUL
MAEELCTVDFAAERLKLHPKTVLRFIREGRLPARRIGKAYRIRRADLDAFAGVPPSETPAAEPSVTTIVDIPGVGAALAQKWARTVTGALNARPTGGASLRADVVYDAAREHLKIIAVGPPAAVVDLMNLVRVWLDQLEV